MKDPTVEQAVNDLLDKLPATDDRDALRRLVGSKGCVLLGRPRFSTSMDRRPIGFRPQTAGAAQ
jgi:hypothetical protein